jgi:hypothetical protein
MTTTTETGGPAFPTSNEDDGMDLRDYFAAKAMQAQLSMPEVFLSLSAKNVTAAEICGSCFEWADAMLKAREQ